MCIVKVKNVCFGQEYIFCCWQMCVFFAGVCVIACSFLCFGRSVYILCWSVISKLVYMWYIYIDIYTGNLYT